MPTDIDYIACGDCIKLMEEIPDGTVDLVITSPPYNTSRNLGNSERALKDNETRYDIYNEKPNDEYLDWTESIFTVFNRIVKTNGVVLYNISYGNENPDIMWNTVSRIITHTPFTVADCIVWKKSSALPNNTTKNKLTRICEFIFVFCRKEELKTFNTNKQIKTVSKSGQKYYENVFNLIEAKNNDGSCDLNKATYSTDLVTKLLSMYSPSEDDVVLDPFLGTGTTAVACVKNNRHYIGFELSPNQFDYACTRLDEAEK